LRDFVDLGEFFMGDVRVAVLDDYWKMAQGAVDWMGLDVASVDFFHDTLIDPAEIIDRLLSYEVLVTTRERTRFSAEVLAGTGGRQANVDMEKATQLGIEVMNTSGSRGRGNSTAELAWAL
jgi:phosphoglycerate dehydrogenase-like enzyme